MAASALTVWRNLPLIDEPLTLHENAVHYDEPLIQFVDNIIQHALQKSASDIHIEPYENICRIRYRQDGLLHEVTEIPNNLAERLMTRLKVMAKLDISERRLPQDGRFQLNKHAIDVRINTCPTLFGEKIALRILDANKILFDVNALGMTDWQKQIFLEKISHPQGLILVTGPTGSGKTVTLYSALHALNTTEKNILTAEDPVEIKLHGINQVNINPKIGLHFATALRTFLRQDPDVIMIGEIRDTETAEIAIQAAQTGHLVLSTLHTNNAIETLMRLESMGITRYNLSNAISLIIAQRLVRKICAYCHAIDFEQCTHCFQGYQGRAGIYEMLPMTEKISRLIALNASVAMLTDHLDQEEFCNLRRMGLEKVAQGITTFAEINRVIL